MAFQYDGRNLPHLRNYEQADKFWSRAAHWRGMDGEHDERVLDKRSKRNVTIRKTRDGDICCKLRHTDVLVFRPNNLIEINPYSSISTDEFFNRLMSYSTVSAEFNRGLIVVGGLTYRADDRMVVEYDPDKQTYKMVSDTAPFILTRVSRRANALLKQLRYNEFRDWLKMVAVSGLAPDDGASPYPRYTQMNVDAMLSDTTQWPRLITWKFVYGQSRVINESETLRKVRERIYCEHSEVIDVETKPYLEDHKEVNAWHRTKNRAY